MKEKIIELLSDIISKNYDIDIKDLSLEIPPKKDLWDFAFPCFQLSRVLKKSPAFIAEELELLISENISEYSLIEEVTVAWPYLNIRLSKWNYTDTFNKLYNDKDALLWTSNSNDKTIVIDYIWANVWKPLHIGHMCTPNQGQTMINIYKKLWYTVISDSHIWDWGIIFGKLITAFKKWWDENKLKENAVEHLFKLYMDITSVIDTEIDNVKKYFLENKELVISFYDSLVELSISGNEINEIYEKLGRGKWDERAFYKLVEIKKQGYNDKWLDFISNDESLEQQTRNEFKKLSEWNSDSVKLWQSFTKESIIAMNIQLARLNVKPDFNIWESFYEWLKLPKMEDYPDLEFSMESIVKELIEKNIATKNNDNSVWVVFNDETKLSSCILQKRDWTHWYLASDLASIKYRVQNWNPEKIIYFVDSRQQLHLKQAFEIADNAGWLEKEQLFHAYNWFISLKDWAMSTRKWKIIKLDKLLDEAETRAEKIILEKRDDIDWDELKSISKIIWIWAIKYGYLKKSRETDIIFDWDEFMTFEWNSWPYIQYAYVRARRILEKSNYYNNNVGVPLVGTQVATQVDSKFTHSEEIELIKKISDYNEILISTTETNSPHILCKYSYELTKTFNTFYNSIHILNEKDEWKKIIRLELIDLFSLVLKDCFTLLWIDMPEKM